MNICNYNQSFVINEYLSSTRKCIYSIISSLNVLLISGILIRLKYYKKLQITKIIYQCKLTNLQKSTMTHKKQQIPSKHVLSVVIFLLSVL